MRYNKYMKYMSLAFEMTAIIGGATYLGVKIDENLKFKTPVATVVLSLFAVFASTYLLIKRITNDKK